MTLRTRQPIKQSRSRLCPVCGNSSARHIHSQGFLGISEASLLRGYDVVACITCGFVYADGVPEPEAFEAYYRNLSKYEYASTEGKESDSDRTRFEETADALSDAITSTESRVLEIGCSTGGLLAALKRRGYRRLVGVDPAPYCAEAAHRLHGIQVVTASIETIPAGLEADFVVLIAVLEHLVDPGDALGRIRGLLAPGGRLYAEVPDASRFAVFEDAPFQQFSTEHINFFSKRSLTNLMHARGFRALATGHAVRRQNEVTCPVVYGAYEKSSEPASTERDAETETSLRAYVEGCQQEDLRLRARIEQGLAPGGRIIVWGVGTHTLRLLSVGGLDPAKIVLFVDSNPKYQKLELHGIPVVSPDDLKDRPEPILISSRGFQREIQDQIRHGLGLTNSLILLYES